MQQNYDMYLSSDTIEKLKIDFWRNILKTYGEKYRTVKTPDTAVDTMIYCNALYEDLKKRYPDPSFNVRCRGHKAVDNDPEHPYPYYDEDFELSFNRETPCSQMCSLIINRYKQYLLLSIDRREAYYKLFAFIFPMDKTNWKNAAQLVTDFYDNYDTHTIQFKDLLRKKNQEYIMEYKKREEARKNTRNIIKTAIPQAVEPVMANIDCEWYLSDEHTYCRLLIKMKYGKMLEIILDHQNYNDKLKKIPMIIGETEQFFAGLPYGIDINKKN